MAGNNHSRASHPSNLQVPETVRSLSTRVAKAARIAEPPAHRVPLRLTFLSCMGATRGGCLRHEHSKLGEKARIVLEEKTDVRDAIAEHGDAIDAEAEGKAAVALRVDPAVTKDIRMDHSRAEHF